MRKRHRHKRNPPSRHIAPATIRPDAAGIDVGATEVYVAVNSERDPDPVAHVLYLHRRTGTVGRVVVRMRRQNRRHGVDRRLLDSAIRHPGGPRL